MKAIVIVWALALLGCPKDPVTPVPDEDGGTIIIDAADATVPATCAAWCDHAAKLSCAAAKKTPDGSPCTTVCDNIQKSGVIKWNLACRVKAKTCALADACEK